MIAQQEHETILKSNTGICVRLLDRQGVQAANII